MKDAKMVVRIWVDQEHRKIKFRLLLDHKERGKDEKEPRMDWLEEKLLENSKEEEKKTQNKPKQILNEYQAAELKKRLRMENSY